MRSTLILLTTALGGCATHLGNYAPAAGQSDGEIAAALSDCQQQAYDAAHTAGENLKRLALKATVVGIPAGISREKAIQREAWAECMEARNFWVERPK